MKIPKKLRIRVTKKNIKYGKPNTTDFCPIALAVKSKIKTSNVSVDGETIELTSSRFNGAIYDLPVRAQKFVDRFDTGDSVKPFSFTATLWYN